MSDLDYTGKTVVGFTAASITGQVDYSGLMGA
jgi:hypothetical protein